MEMYPPSHYLHSRNFTYFSFFSELSHSDPWVTIMETSVETLVLVAVLLLSVVANVGAMALVIRERRRILTNRTLLTLNLFTADLLFVSMSPLIVAVRWTVSWRLGRAACRTVLYVICMSGCVTITTLVAISVERVWAILRLQRGPTFNPRMVSATLGFIWAFSSLTAMPLCLYFTVMEVDHLGEITKHCRRRLSPRRSSTPSCPSSRDYKISRQDIKLFRTLFVLMLSFFIMWSPIFIITFLIMVRNFQGRLLVSSTMFFWVVTFTLANSALNPILYSVCQFRQFWKRLYCKKGVTPVKG
ncbi:free fatty acid receptor 4-like [Aplochiton taeniatus]